VTQSLRITYFDDLALRTMATFFSVGLFEFISVAVCDRAFTAVGRSVGQTKQHSRLPNYLSKRLVLCAASATCTSVLCVSLRSWKRTSRRFKG